MLRLRSSETVSAITLRTQVEVKRPSSFEEAGCLPPRLFDWSMNPMVEVNCKADQVR